MKKHLLDSCAAILSAVLTKKASLKTCVYASNNKQHDTKQVLALCSNTLKYKTVLEEIIESSNIMQLEKSFQGNVYLAMLLIYQLLFYRGSIQWGKYKTLVARHKTRLRSELARLKVKRKVVKNEDLLPEALRNQVHLPRYVRVNLIKSTMDKVIMHFIKDGYTLQEPSGQLLEPKTFSRDEDLDDLLEFPPKIDLHIHPLFLNGTLVLQDKASCFPAYILNPTPGSICIDACAAPGNKTSHLASIMRNKGTVHAFDSDKRRLETLIKGCERQGATCVKPLCVDFLKVDPNDPNFINVSSLDFLYGQAEYILLDPSCSGSGIVSRLDQFIDSTVQSKEMKEDENERLEALAEFQLSALKHAMKFPNVQKITYSTCSVHAIENELVAIAAIDQNGEWKIENALGDWKRRGLTELSDARSKLMVRALPDDRTIGFFTVLLVRVK